MSNPDPALETLLLPFAHDRLKWPEVGTLFLRARGGATLKAHSIPDLVCEQSFKPDAAALERAGFNVASGEADGSSRYPLVLLLPPRQRDESRALMARAISLLSPGGIVVASAGNNEGARSAESDLERLAGSVETLVKNKCRVFWTAPLDGPSDSALAAQWLALDAVRPVVEGRFLSRPGIFAWDRIDVASRLLAEQFPAGLVGDAADLGAGFGYLSAELLARSPGIRSVHLYEAEARALELARKNLAGTVKLGFHWHDVTEGLPHKYDVIVTNPPFHTGSRRDRPDLGQRFITVAAESLKPGGQLWLVANRHLPYEVALNKGFTQTRVVAERDGFKVIQAVKAERA